MALPRNLEGLEGVSVGINKHFYVEITLPDNTKTTEDKRLQSH